MKTIKQIAIFYLGIGLVISLVLEIKGLFISGPSAFIWTGSLSGNIITFFWWFVVPALTWPYDLFWTVYHSMFT
ncbi:hypothetical protein A2914_00910 [Candidatus Nomurabacteria bacterium RIFCSPLOWO2_01_FULL_41_21]|uniref:Uncharacterized protein n=2 Tax=Candidatus Nomuraibacteriota TaxID=1752729 RepID=A0A1F6V1S2_9BACT|nr:MAG: hypothetical protein A2733_02000 [Candidatus Nomurabacteria bacterium RIFCSPHIGHO2_01_FULL_40_20]OGI87876.1 MAG: hypothetical protein A2914_00910 [Candidatus Nomurabacteria bacterium RIFCSPLOWO2_01_FULL_41_21]